MSEFLDITGRPIKEGDFVLYSRVIGQRASLRFYLVVDVKSFVSLRLADAGGKLVGEPAAYRTAYPENNIYILKRKLGM